MTFHREQGVTLAELMVVVALATLLLGAVASYALPMIAREDARSSVYDIQGYLQLARIEALSRNHPCRFVLHSKKLEIAVLDTKGTSSPLDDEQLYRKTLPRTLGFGSPGGGGGITLQYTGTSFLYQTVFAADGTVIGGAGGVGVLAGERFSRVDVFAAGGTRIEHWDGSSWVAGS